MRTITITYRGKPVTVELVPIDDAGHELEAKAATAWTQMRLAAEIDGVRLRARTAFRSFDFQRRLHDAYVAYTAYLVAVREWEHNGGLGPVPKKVPIASLANAPGTSTHEVGNAVDIDLGDKANGDVSGWLAGNSERFGWKRTVPSEEWHYNFFA